MMIMNYTILYYTILYYSSKRYYAILYYTMLYYKPCSKVVPLSLLVRGGPLQPAGPTRRSPIEEATFQAQQELLS